MPTIKYLLEIRDDFNYSALSLSVHTIISIELKISNTYNNVINTLTLND